MTRATARTPARPAAATAGRTQPRTPARTQSRAQPRNERPAVRPELRLVPPSARPRRNVVGSLRNRRAPFVLLVVALLVGTTVGLLVLNTAIAVDSLKATQLRAENAQRAQEVQRLEQQVVAAGTPAEIASAAVAAGLVPAGPAAYLVIDPDGTSVLRGTPVPAEGGEATDDEATDDEATDDEATDDEATDDEATEDEAAEDGATANGAVDESADDGTADESVDDGTADESVEDESAEDETTEDEAIDEAAADDGAATDGDED